LGPDIAAPQRFDENLPYKFSVLSRLCDFLSKFLARPACERTKREYNKEPERSGNMIGAVNFCGRSGDSYKFESVGVDKDWVKMAGVVLFAAPEGRGWRVIAVSDQGGVDGDIQAFWRWREARRYGATAVFVRRDGDITRRRQEAADLNAGLDPVCASASEGGRIAA
jgi:hypothetical protein